MGCNSSLPLDHGDGRLPVKPHLRTTYAQSSAAPSGGFTNTGGVTTQATKSEGHDIVLLCSYTGVSWAGALQAELQGRHGLAVWCPVDASKAITRMSSLHDGEIRPAADNVRVPGGLDINVSQVAGMVSHAPLGLLVLVTAGSTWDEGVLACLRHPSCKDKPLLLLHAPESCPAPNVSDWPADVQQQLISRGTPRMTYISCYAQYGAATAVANLQRQLRQRSGKPAHNTNTTNNTNNTNNNPSNSSASQAGTSSVSKDTSHASTASPTTPLPRISTNRLSSPSQLLVATAAPSTTTTGPHTPAAPGLVKAASLTHPITHHKPADPPLSHRHSRETHHTPAVLNLAIPPTLTQPWQHMLQRLDQLKQQSSGGLPTVLSKEDRSSNGSHKLLAADPSGGSRTGSNHGVVPTIGAEGDAPITTRASAGDAAPAAVVGHLPISMRPGSAHPAVVLAVHHPAMLRGVRATAQALASHFHIAIVDGCRTPDRPARHTLHEFNIPNRFLGVSSSSSSSSSSDDDTKGVDLPRMLPSSIPENQPGSPRAAIAATTDDLKPSVAFPTISLPTLPLNIHKVPSRPASPSAVHANLSNSSNDLTVSTTSPADRSNRQSTSDSGAAQNAGTSIPPTTSTAIPTTTDTSTFGKRNSSSSGATTSTLAARRSASCALPNTAIPASPAPAPAPTPTAAEAKSTTTAFSWLANTHGSQTMHHTNTINRTSHHKHHHHHHHSHHSRSISMGTLPWPFHTSMTMQHDAGRGGTGLGGGLQGLGVDETGHPYKVVASGTEEALNIVRGCSHYVLFTGYSLGTASPQAAAEVQLAMQSGATVHLVCEASFNLLHPDARRWSLTPAEAMKLTSAWLQRMLFYPDHADPFLAELTERLITGTTNDSVVNCSLLSSPRAAHLPAPHLRPPTGTTHGSQSLGTPSAPHSTLAISAASAHTTAPPVRTSADARKSRGPSSSLTVVSAAPRRPLSATTLPSNTPTIVTHRPDTSQPNANGAAPASAVSLDVRQAGPGAAVPSVSVVDTAGVSRVSVGEAFFMDRLGSSDTCQSSSSPMDVSTGPGSASHLHSLSANTTATGTAATTPGAPAVTAQLLHSSHTSSVGSGVVDLCLQVKGAGSGAAEGVCAATQH